VLAAARRVVHAAPTCAKGQQDDLAMPDWLEVSSFVTHVSHVSALSIMCHR
jgi:hypothetical protein